MICLGLDIGGTRLKAAVLRDGQVIAQHAGAPYEQPTFRVLLDRIREVVGVLHADDTPGGRFQADAIGLSVPGVLSADRERVEYSANVPGLVGMALSILPVAAGLGKLAPVVTTDQNAAATDYVGLHDVRGFAIRGRLLAISIGTGVGAAVLDVSDAHPLGRPLRVNGDSPGHLGQIDLSLSDDPPVGSDGGAGSLEAYLGAAALAGRDPKALIVADPPIRALVRALRICHAIYRPHEIALLGGVGIRLSHLAEILRERVNDQLTALARPGWRLGFGTDDFHAARGAARLASGV